MRIDATEYNPYLATVMAESSRVTRRSRWRPKTPYRLVVVEWEDSQRPLSPWQWLDEYELPDAVRCLSVGFLVSETERALALVPNLGDLEQERAQGCGIIRIPRSAVLRIADL